MAVDVKKISSNRAHLNVSVSKDDIKKAYDAELLKYQKQIALPGFRKGKTPISVLDTKIGSEIIKDVCMEQMNNAIIKNIEEVEKDLRPLPYARPEILDYEKLLPFKKDADLNFAVEYDITPDFELSSYKDLEVEIPNVSISDEMIEKEIERYRQQNSIVKAKGADAVVEKDDIVTIDYVVKEEGNEVEKIDDFTFTIGQKTSKYDFDDECSGLKEGEEKTFTKDDAGKSKEFTIKVKTIKVKELPVVDDEFAQDIKSDYKTVEDLRNGIKKNLEDQLDDRMKETKISKICEKILENTKIDIPDSMVDYEVESTFSRIARSNGMRPSDFENFLHQIGQTKEVFTANWRSDATENLKKRLIVDKVEALEKLTADEEKLKSLIEKEIPKEATEDQKKYYEDSLRDQLAFEAAIDWLIKNNKLLKSAEAVSYEDFVSGKYLEKEEEEKRKKELKAGAEEKKEKKAKKAAGSKDADSKEADSSSATEASAEEKPKKKPAVKKTVKKEAESESVEKKED